MLRAAFCFYLLTYVAVICWCSGYSPAADAACTRFTKCRTDVSLQNNAFVSLPFFFSSAVLLFIN